MDLIFVKTSRLATSVLQIWLFEHEDADEDEDDVRTSGSSSLPY